MSSCNFHPPVSVLAISMFSILLTVPPLSSLLLPTSLVSSVPDFLDIPFHSPLGLAFRRHRVWCRPYHLFPSSSCITTTFIRFAAPPFSLPPFLPVSPSLSWIVLRSLTFRFLRVWFFASQPTVSTSALRVNCFSLIFFVLICRSTH